ncbi:hypothetical protein NW062_05860 [Mycoplasmopsis cynos]|nr:hypothetical protein NW062_05860 [Mycoplasmopsis cynos]
MEELNWFNTQIRCYFRDYYNTRNNKLISKHNVFNQESKKMAID